jgi:hypothetical protein
MKNRIFYKLIITIILISLFQLWNCADNTVSDKKVVPYSFESDQKSEIFTVTVQDTRVPVAVVPNVDTRQTSHIVEEYKKLPEYCWIEDRYITAHYVHFSADSIVNLEVNTNEQIKKFTIYPRRTHVKASIDENRLNFSLDQKQSRYYLLSINELPMLVIIMESNIEKADPSEMISLEKFSGGEKSIDDYTEVFNKAIDKVDGTGKTLYIPAGEYITDAIKIVDRSNFNIYLESGSLIKIKPSPPGENIPSAGILIKNSKNIRIYGNGCLDHQAYENFHDGINDYHYGFPGYDYYFKFEDVKPNSIYLQSPVMLIYSQNITIEGLLIRNGRNYNVNSRHCDNITIRNVKVITPAGSVPENTDGINIGSYRNFLIENSFVYCNDDCFSMGHNLLPYDNRSEQNLVIRNFVGWNPRANAVRLGWASNTYNGDMLFQNCDFSGMDDGSMIIHKHTSTGKVSPDSLCYGTVRFENCTFDDVDRYTRQLIEVQNVCMKSLEYVNVSFDAIPKIKANIYGDAESKIGTLLIDNMMIGGEKVTKDNINFDLKNIKKIIIK